MAGVIQRHGRSGIRPHPVRAFGVGLASHITGDVEQLREVVLQPHKTAGLFEKHLVPITAHQIPGLEEIQVRDVTPF